MERIVQPELLDEDLGTPGEIAESLHDLRRINTWFGGIRTTTQLLRRIACDQRRSSLALLEIGAGRGDVPLAAKRCLKSEGIELKVTLLDRVSSHLPNNGIPAVAANARQLPFSENAFDVVSCNLLAHHFEPEALSLVADEGLRVARIALLINDLIRSPVHLALTYAGFPLFRSRITRHDATASVRRAYTLDEMRSIMRRTTASRVEMSTHYLYRMGILLWK